MRVLAIGAHPDDIEIGCGGTLLRHLAEGDEVHALVLTGGEGGNANPRTRGREAEAAAKTMSVTSLRFGRIDAREMHCVRHEYGDVIIRVVDDVAPDRVYCHNEHDRHQNHVAAARCSLIATKRVRQVLSFKLPSTTADFQPTFYVDVSDYVARKLECLAVFESQAHKDCMQEWWLKAVMAGHAVEAGVTHGACEAFYVERMVR